VREILNQRYTPCPEFDLEREERVHLAMTDLIMKGYVQSAHDVSEGGVFVTLMESAMAGQLGFSIALPGNARKDIFLFSESQGRVVISIAESDLTFVQQLLAKHDVPFVRLGAVTGGTLEIAGQSLGNIEEWKPAYQNALSEILEQ